MHDQLIDSSSADEQEEYENEHVLVTFSSKLGHEAADQLVQVFTRQCPQLNIQLRRHHQNSSYALDVSLLEADDADDDRPIHSSQQPESAADRLVRVKKLLENAVTDQDLELDFDPTNATNRLHIASGIPLVRQLQSKSPRLIRSLIPLHQPAMLKRLQRRWVFVSPLRLLSPPIGQIGAYFGLEIGLYFAWLAHFTGWLCAPALIGSLLFLLPSSDDSAVELAKFLLFALFNSAWAIAFLRSWERRQRELTASKEKTEKEKDQEEKATFLEQLEQKTAAFGLPSALGSVRLRLDFWRPADALSLSALSAMLLALLRLQDWTKAEFGAGWTSTAPVILQGLVCIGAETFYRRMATEAEAADSKCANGKDGSSSSSDVDDDRTLIYRLALFQSISAFCPLFYIAFWLGDWPRLQETLATLLITRQFVQNFTEIGVPLVLGRLRMLQLAFVGNRAARRRASSWQVGDEEQELVDGSAGGKSSAERQAALSEYGRPVDDYLEIFVQLGYVLLFSPAFPLAALCALCNNLLEARVDAFKLCAVHRRPWPRAAQPAQEAWQSAIKLMCLAGVSTNLALVLLRCLIVANDIKE